MELDGRVAVVTGAGAGIGRAIALRLAREGAHVVVADVDDRLGVETAGLAGSARFFHADLTRDEDIRALLQEAPALDVLVNNAGGAAEHSYPDAPPGSGTACSTSTCAG